MKFKIDTLYHVVATVLEVDEKLVTIESGYGIDNGWDSLAHISIIGAIENEFKIEIADDDIERLISLRTIVEYLNMLEQKK